MRRRRRRLRRRLGAGRSTCLEPAPSTPSSLQSRRAACAGRAWRPRLSGVAVRVEHHGRLRQSRTRPTHRTRRAGLRPPAARAPGTRQVAAVVDRLGLLQIDSVNVFERSHYLPVFSRVGDYDKGVLDRLTMGRRGRMLEYWAHEASFIPRRALAAVRVPARGIPPGGAMGRLARRDPRARRLAARRARRERADACQRDRTRRQRTPGPWWGWSDVKRALEWIFRVGEVVCVERRRFERVYALPSRARARAARTAAERGRRGARARRSARRPPTASPPTPTSPTTGA